MGRNTDDLKGRVEEAARDLTRGKRLKVEGKTDRAADSAKDAVENRQTTSRTLYARIEGVGAGRPGRRRPVQFACRHGMRRGP
jgi:uncharacterized protein YjbJ (UPF0337 family)